MPIMWALSRRKLNLADALGSRALRTDAVESITCGWLSLVVVAGLLAQLARGAWWVDAATSLAIVWLLVKKVARLGRGKRTTIESRAVPPAINEGWNWVALTSSSAHDARQDVTGPNGRSDI
jgi:divalent metal cation (Fe/Co/Zn/Cd) transporter